MTIDETAIRQWADRHECRSNLPILVRRLIRETTSSLVSLRFPGNEAVDLSGLDGQAEAKKSLTLLTSPTQTGSSKAFNWTAPRGCPTLISSE